MSTSYISTFLQFFVRQNVIIICAESLTHFTTACNATFFFEFSCRKKPAKKEADTVNDRQRIFRHSVITRSRVSLLLSLQPEGQSNVDRRWRQRKLHRVWVGGRAGWSPSSVGAFLLLLFYGFGCGHLDTRTA